MSPRCGSQGSCRDSSSMKQRNTYYFMYGYKRLLYQMYTHMITLFRNGLIVTICLANKLVKHSSVVIVTPIKPFKLNEIQVAAERCLSTIQFILFWPLHFLKFKFDQEIIIRIKEEVPIKYQVHSCYMPNLFLKVCLIHLNKSRSTWPSLIYLMKILWPETLNNNFKRKILCMFW